MNVGETGSYPSFNGAGSISQILYPTIRISGNMFYATTVDFVYYNVQNAFQTMVLYRISSDGIGLVHTIDENIMTSSEVQHFIVLFRNSPDMNTSSRLHINTRPIQVNVFIVMATNHIYTRFVYILYSISYILYPIFYILYSISYILSFFPCF